MIGNWFFHWLSLLINGNTTNSSSYRNIICTHIIHSWQIWEDKFFTPILVMTVELYQQHMINRNGLVTATAIEAAANLFGLNINIWLQQSSHCTLSSFNASSPTCIDILLSRNHFSPLKLVHPITDNSFDILKKQLKRQGQQNKTSNNKKRKLSTKITPHMQEGNRQTEQESEKQCQFDEYFTLFLFLFFKFELYYNEYIHGLAFLQRAQHFQICDYIGSQVC